MPGIDINSLVQIASLKPSATIDGKQPVANPRAGRYAEQYTLTLVPTTHLLADEGSYFTANNGQTGQVSAAAAPVAFTATTPWVIIYNGSSPTNSSSPKIYLDYVSLAVSVQGATMTSVQMAVVRDLGNRFSALGTGGVSLSPQKLNSAGPGSVAQVWTGGQMTATAATPQAATVVGNRILTARAAPASVTGDVYSLAFGSVDKEFTGAITATLASPLMQPAPPVILNPGESALIYIWFPAMATTGVTLLPEIGWWER